jgi:orotate phosphoribosyltransferase
MIDAGKVVILEKALGMLKSKSKLEYLRQEIEENGIYRVAPDGNRLPAKQPNMSYTWQFYLRRCMFEPKFISTAAELLVEKLPSTDIQIGACEDAGVPLGAAMAAVLGTPMISVKKSRKVYGLMNFTEGKVTGKPILLVDDLAGSQSTLKVAARTLEAFKLPVADQYATLINKTQGTHPESYMQQRQLISLFTCDDFAMSWSAYVEKYGRTPDFGKHY